MENYPNFVAYVQNGKIFNQFGQVQGVINEEYDKALKVAKGFQEKLIEAGILTKPKTAEEINQELQETLKKTQEMMSEMSSTIVSLNQKVTELEKEKDDVKQSNSNAISKSLSRK